MCRRFQHYLENDLFAQHLDATSTPGNGIYGKTPAHVLTLAIINCDSGDGRFFGELGMTKRNGDARPMLCIRFWLVSAFQWCGKENYQIILEWNKIIWDANAISSHTAGSWAHFLTVVRIKIMSSCTQKT